jgi:hypothetical protein
LFSDLGERRLIAFIFRAWFTEFDVNAWDRQFERDVSASKLDTLADKAIRDHASGKTKPL